MALTAQDKLHRRRIFSEVPFEFKAPVPCLVYHAGNYLWVVRKPAPVGSSTATDWDWSTGRACGTVYGVFDELTGQAEYHAVPRHRRIAVNAIFDDWDTAIAYVAASAMGRRVAGYGLQETEPER